MHIYLCVTILIKVKEAINLIVVGAYGMSCGLKTERKLNVPFFKLKLKGIGISRIWWDIHSKEVSNYYSNFIFS